MTRTILKALKRRDRFRIGQRVMLNDAGLRASKQKFRWVGVIKGIHDLSGIIKDDPPTKRDFSLIVRLDHRGRTSSVVDGNGEWWEPEA